jgi:hypothetical protein
MNPDDLQQAWQAQAAQSRLTIDAELLLKEVRRNQRHFTATIFWRDVREVGTALVMVPVWIYLGATLSLPWAWYFTVPALAWIAGFMLVDRIRHQRQKSSTNEPLRQHVETALAEIEHQIWLLRNVFWWYLLPCAISVSLFFCQVAWQGRSDGWLTVVVMGFAFSVAIFILAGIYSVNQHAVRSELVPRRQELEALLASLRDEPPGTS